jgi:cytochrome c peroxidase
MSRIALVLVLGMSGGLTASCSSSEPSPTPTPPTEAGSDVQSTPDVSVKDGHDSATSIEPDASGPDASDAKEEPTGLEFAPPYPAVVYPVENPKKAEIAMLGKILFWEEQIGELDNMACGTCHRPEGGGSDPRASEAASLNLGKDGIMGTPDDVRGGRGVVHCDHTTHLPYAEGGTVAQITGRKPPTYFDAMFFPYLFWDGRAGEEFIDPVSKKSVIAKGAALETQASGPPTNPTEMGCEDTSDAGTADAAERWTYIATKLTTVVPLARAKYVPDAMKAAITAAGNSYPNLFQAAWGSAEVTPAHIIMSIANHERTLTSNDTPWDRFNGGEKTALTAAQQRGLALFNTKARCNLCHQPPLFSDAARGPGLPVGKNADGGASDGFHNVGFLDPSIDQGRGSGQMKTPTLRNVGLREAGGLMHNGTGPGATLGDVLNAYKAGGSVATNRDGLMQQLDLTTAELDDLADFLRNGLTDARVKDEQPPFDKPILSTEPVK